MERGRQIQGAHKSAPWAFSETDTFSLRNLHEARTRALLISEALNSGTDQRLEQVRDNRRVTFQEAVDLLS